MNISAIEPISQAWNHMVRILFKPFEIKKWFVLGFCAFLAQCDEMGGNGGNYYSYSGNNGPNVSIPGGFDEGKAWIETNFSLFLTILISGVVLVILVGLLIKWLSSRGKFMLLDGIVKNRGAIKEPWTEYKTEGNSLFLFSIVNGLLVLLTFSLIAGISVLIALPDIQSETFGGAGVAAIVVGGSLMLLFILACIALSAFVKILMVPTMYLKRVRAIEGWKIAWNQLLKGHVGSFILLILMMFLLGIGAGVVATLAICATCCVGALPYISSVLFLPITVFFVCYALCYIQQFGGDWTFFKNMCRFCHYNMEGLEEGCACPECGK
jgi:hypothetical protein